MDNVQLTIMVSPLATYFNIFPQEIPQLSTVNFQLSIRANGALNCNWHFPAWEKLVFTFSAKWCMIAPNRVGDLALSATGTGSCPVDEGYFCDEVTAPAAHIG